MRCEKCGGEWIPPKNISVSLTNCPFCGAPILNVETASNYTEMGDLLKYLVSLYGAELYKNRQKLSNLIADFYRGDERLKRAYRRAILEDTIAQRVYELSLKPLSEREAFCNQIISQFAEANFYSNEFGKQLVDSFTMGLQLEIMPPISTKVTKEDGRWIDEFRVIYSSDRKKLIRANEYLESYRVKDGTIAICDGAFSWCDSLTNLTLSDSVVSIGDEAFSWCSALTYLTIPGSVANIGGCAFPNNETFILHLENNNHFIVQDEILYTANGKRVICCLNNMKCSILIPTSVTSIGNYAFKGCSSLTNITIPNSVSNVSIKYRNFF